MTIAEFQALISAHETSTGMRPSVVSMSPADIALIQDELVASAFTPSAAYRTGEGPITDIRPGACMRLLGIDIVPDKTMKGGGIGVTVS